MNGGIVSKNGLKGTIFLFALVVAFAYSPAPAGADASRDANQVAATLQRFFSQHVARPSSHLVAGQDRLMLPNDDGAGYAVAIPKNAGEPIGLQGAANVLVSASQSNGGYSFIGGLAVLPHSFPSTDTIVTTDGPSGFETYYLLEDPAAPETFESHVDVPDGYMLEQTSSDEARVVDSEGMVLMQVEAPWAVDASGKQVPLTLSVAGSAVLLHVAHRTGSFTYPILADPTFYTNGDNVHYSHEPGPKTASAHGWWTTSDPELRTKKAHVTIWLQFHYASGWTTVDKDERDVYQGGGGGKVAVARQVCNQTLDAGEWRSKIDVDIIGVADTADQHTTPEQWLLCRP